MQILREVEEHLIHINQNEISILIHPSMSAYILNNKKQNIFDIEKRHNVKIIFNIENNFSISEYKIVENEKNINNLKILLANETTKILHGSAASKKAEKSARDTFQKGGIGSDLPEIEIKLSEIKNGINSQFF